MNVDGLLRGQAERNPDKVALVDGAVKVTWQALDEQVEELARGLAELGLVGGHRVALALANSADLVVCYLGILRGGLVAVPINPTSRPGEIARVLADSGSRVCFADAGTVEVVREAVSARTPVPLVVVVGSATRPGEIGYDELPAVGATTVTPLDPESLAVLLYTSGTSGWPRAAMLSHRALLANIEQSASTKPAPVARERRGARGAADVPHLRSQCGAWAGPADRGDPGDRAPVRRNEHPGADRARAGELRPDRPAGDRRLARRAGRVEQLSSVTMLISGAAPLPEDRVRAFEAQTGITVEQGFGLTEAGPVVTSTIGTPKAKPRSAGRALPGVELRVVDDSGADADPADPGEIWVRGRNLFSGYWPAGDEAPGLDGWLRTGDIGFLDADGDLFLVDRLKELVLVSGFNVYPSEVEDVVSEVEGVGECAVIGVADDATGEAIVAYVVASAPGLDRDGSALAAAVTARCLDRLARFKVPSRIELVERLPHSATGKVAKGRLRAGQARHEMGLS